MSFYLIGDTHDTKVLNRILSSIPDGEEVLSVGDNGIGFPGYEQEVFKEGFRFLQGNHDNPVSCDEHPQFLGRYGIDWIGGKKIMYISGALSVDKDDRVSGVSWWKREELDWAEGNAVVDLARSINRRDIIIVSHDCPMSVSGFYSHTGKLLDVVLDIVRPSRWYYGHHHKSSTTEVYGTLLRCLGVEEVVLVI